MPLNDDQQHNESQHPLSESEQPSQQPPEPANRVDNSATRVQRFVAAMIDGFLGLTLTLPLFDHFGLWELMKTGGEVSTSVSIQMTVYGLGMFFVLHGVLLYKYGQTLGKRLMGIAIVTLDGQKPSFSNLILNRYLPQWVAGFVPMLGPVLGIVDALFIFREDKRCIHDLIAGTKVIDLKIKTQEKPNSIIL